MITTKVDEELKNDIDKQKNEYNKKSGYDKQVALEKINEHNRELDVFEQVEEATRRKR